MRSARSLFVEEGFENVSMRKIADEVGCAPGTIYLHFPDKASILGSICEETFAKLASRMEAIRADSHSNALEKLRREGRAYITFALEHPHHYLLTFGRPGGKVDEAADSAGERCFDCLRSSVRHACEAGYLRTEDVEAVAQSLWAASHGVVMLLISKCDFPFVEQSRLIENCLDMMIEGIRRR